MPFSLRCVQNSWGGYATDAVCLSDCLSVNARDFYKKALSDFNETWGVHSWHYGLVVRSVEVPPTSTPLSYQI